MHLPDPPDPTALSNGQLRDRVSLTELDRLPHCSLSKARRMVSRGAQLCVHLDQISTLKEPVWRVTLRDTQGQHWALVGVKFKQPRQLRSVQRVYQVARNLGVEMVTIPVDQ